MTRTAGQKEQKCQTIEYFINLSSDFNTVLP